MFSFISRLSAVGILIVGVALQAEESWPQFLGPHRDGTSTDVLGLKWGQEGPSVRWKREVGQGFAGPAVEHGKVILYHRLADKDVLECMQSTNGVTVWKYETPSTYSDDFGFDEGPRAVPTIVGKEIYTLGADGLLNSVELSSGKLRWSVKLREKFSADKGFFGMACAPVVSSDLLLVNAGGKSGYGLVAFRRTDGSVAWHVGNDEAGYSSPVLATINGEELALFFTRAGLTVVRPKSGEVTASFPWRSRTHGSVNAAAPLVLGDLIFLSSSYETGAVLLRYAKGVLEKVWSKDRVLSSHYATSVLRAGFLYGFDGRQEQRPTLTCVKFSTGDSAWREESIGSGTILSAANTLVVMMESGELLLVEPSSRGFKKLAQAQVLPNGVRAYPALADGFLYARSKNQLYCVDLRPAKP